MCLPTLEPSGGHGPHPKDRIVFYPDIWSQSGPVADQFHTDVVDQRVADDLAREQIQKQKQIKPAFQGSQIDDEAGPLLIRCRGIQLVIKQNGCTVRL